MPYKFFSKKYISEDFEKTICKALMPSPARLFLYFISLAFLLTTYSCETLHSRISQNRDFYYSLPESHQKIIAQGNIEVGFTKGEVFLAWGEPSHKSFTQNTKNSTENWIYTRIQTETYYSQDRYYSTKGKVWVTERKPHHHYNEFVAKVVNFVDDKVDSITIYPNPIPYRRF